MPAAGKLIVTRQIAVFIQIRLINQLNRFDHCNDLNIWITIPKAMVEEVCHLVLIVHLSVHLVTMGLQGMVLLSPWMYFRRP